MGALTFNTIENIHTRTNTPIMSRKSGEICDKYRDSCFITCLIHAAPASRMAHYLIHHSLALAHLLHKTSFITMSVACRLKKTAFTYTSRMRSFHHPALTSTLALPLVLLICFTLYVLKTTNRDSSASTFIFQSGGHKPSITLHSSTASKAPQLSPTELMARPLIMSTPHMPRLFHQSWSSATLPAKFEQWSLSCREMNPGYEWVLWTDKDNRRLVEKYAPEFLEKYDGLKSEIYRADAVRNLYMFIFGG